MSDTRLKISFQYVSYQQLKTVEIKNSFYFFCIIPEPGINYNVFASEMTT